jgi:hypothetical protein
MKPGRSGRGSALAGLGLAAMLAGCAAQPKAADEVWAGVVQVYSAADLAQPFNKDVRERFARAGLGEKDADAGRLLRVACGLGADYAWGSYDWLPPGAQVGRNGVVRLRVDEAPADDRMGLNRVLAPVPGAWGSKPAYSFIPDWKERGLSRNIERIPLPPADAGRYVIVHSNYLVKCRPPG